MYPWLVDQWREIRDNLDRLPAAMMFVGAPGLGKTDLALALAQRWHCLEPLNNEACGSCTACAAWDKGIDPDLHLLTSGQHALDFDEQRNLLATRYTESGDKDRKPRQVITVNQVRTLIENVTTHAHGRGPRVVLIVPASSLNINAANALLKVLEEPPGDTRFLLVSSSRDSVPATVLSRVSMVECRVPDHGDATSWLVDQGVSPSHCAELLALASGAPVAALRLHEAGFSTKSEKWRRELRRMLDNELMPVAMAADIGSRNASGFLFWLETFLTDTLRTHHGRKDPASLAGSEAADRELTSRLISRPLWDIIEKLQLYRRHQPRVIDEQLFLEDVLIAVWQKV
jgi:DNA polymerase III subunit delta'